VQLFPENKGHGKTKGNYRPTKATFGQIITNGGNGFNLIGGSGCGGGGIGGGTDTRHGIFV
jgi:hypothetical protein